MTTTPPSTVPQVPFSGRMSYCLIRSLHMLLAQRGHDYPVAWLECVSGEPFGFVYLRGAAELFAVVGYAYHEAGQHLLRTLGYDYSFTSAGESDTAALATLDTALRDGPVAVGMLDMGYLTYAPDHLHARGADHAIVVLARRGDTVVVHDPAGYPAALLPLADFLQAWQRDIYTGKPYGLWRIGAHSETPDADAIWDRTINHARELYTRSDEIVAPGVTAHYGPQALRLLAEDLRAQPERSLGALPYFSWRVSGQRCFDSATFLHERLPDAAAIRWEQCQLYGEIQQASTSASRSQLAGLLERQADLESAFITLLR
jgi:Butirosin biosynthesis protein H, N-terminal